MHDAACSLAGFAFTLALGLVAASRRPVAAIARARRRRRLARDAALRRARPAPRRRDPRGRAPAARGPSPGRRPHVRPRRPRRRRSSSPARSRRRRSRPWRRASSSTGRRGIPYTRPTPAVGVGYVWDANYDGFRWPRKTTTVLKVKAPPRSLYWRATTLDLFTGDALGRGAEPVAVRPLRRAPRPHADGPARDGRRPRSLELEQVGGRDRVARGQPPRRAERAGRLRAGVRRRAVLAGRHRHALARAGEGRPLSGLELLAAPGAGAARVVEAALPGRGAALPRGPPRRRSAAGVRLARPRRRAARGSSRSYPDYRALYAKARRVAGSASSPYGAALALESWLRTTGGFSYTTHPPASGPQPLLDFVVRTKRGYCQHFAGAMALMLRYLGIPSRVAEGFVSGTYDCEHADLDGHRPRRARVGRGLVRRLRLAAVRPDAGPRLALGGLLDLVARLPSRGSGGHRRPGRRGAARTRRRSTRTLSFGDKDSGAAFLGADIRRTRVRPAERSASSSAAAASASCSRSLLALVVALARCGEGGSQAHALRGGRSATAGAGLPGRPARLPRRPGHPTRAERRPRASWRALARVELEVDGSSLAAALAAARFGPPPEAATAARACARGARAASARGCAAGSGSCARARGLVSLRSLGFAGVNAPSSWPRARDGACGRSRRRWPKPVLPIDGRPVVATLLRELSAAGLRRASPS